MQRIVHGGGLELHSAHGEPLDMAPVEGVNRQWNRRFGRGLGQDFEGVHKEDMNAGGLVDDHGGLCGEFIEEPGKVDQAEALHLIEVELVVGVDGVIRTFVGEEVPRPEVDLLQGVGPRDVSAPLGVGRMAGEIFGLSRLYRTAKEPLPDLA